MKKQKDHLSRSHVIDLINDSLGAEIGYRFKYGIHETEVVAGESHLQRIHRTLGHLCRTARSELQAAGEKTDLEIIADAMATSPHDAEARIKILGDWAWDIGHRRKQADGRLQRAAWFLATIYCVVSRDPVGDDGIGSSVLYFAEAWHRWHMEAFEEHALAYTGKLTRDNLAEGGGAVRKKRQSREAIVLREIRNSITSTAGQIVHFHFKNLNTALEGAGHRPFPSEAAARKYIQRLKRTA
jgi:hypothetical protein